MGRAIMGTNYMPRDILWTIKGHHLLASDVLNLDKPPSSATQWLI